MTVVDSNFVVQILTQQIKDENPSQHNFPKHNAAQHSMGLSYLIVF